MKAIASYFLAALFEIAGCFSLWVVLRQHRSVWWLVPGSVSLIAFAYLLTRVELSFAGRAYAAYGGIYITASLLWLWLVERTVPDRYDVLGALLCLSGTSIIVFAPRAS